MEGTTGAGPRREAGPRPRVGSAASGPACRRRSPGAVAARRPAPEREGRRGGPGAAGGGVRSLAGGLAGRRVGLPVSRPCGGPFPDNAGAAPRARRRRPGVGSVRRGGSAGAAGAVLPRRSGGGADGGPALSPRRSGRLSAGRRSGLPRGLRRVPVPPPWVTGGAERFRDGAWDARLRGLRRLSGACAGPVSARCAPREAGPPWAAERAAG